MLNTININLKTDIKTDRPTTLPIKLMSQDKNNNQFILRFTNGGESITLDDSYTVEVLTKFTKSGTSRLTTAKVRQDYATWEFDTAYIAQDETVYNYVYVRKSGILLVSADSNAFYFAVGLSEIDRDAGRVAETYDENYEKVLLDYSDALDDRTTERLDLAVDDFNQRGDAEIADWRADADVELDGKADKVVIKNVLNNPNFSNGLDGWEQSINQEAVVSGNEVTVITTSQGQFGIYQRYNAEGLKYISAEFYSDDGSSQFRIGDTFVDTSIPEGVWSRVSHVGEDTGLMRLYAHPGPDYMYKMRNPIVINLTETFGAGKEPTTEEMDELIKVTGYIDGEYALNNKEMLNWQLKLMRQNRNALIALGGTII